MPVRVRSRELHALAFSRPEHASMRMRSYSLLTIAIVLIVGFLLGGVSWAAARMLTAGTRQRPWDERVPLLLSSLCGAALLVVATLNPATTWQPW